MRPKSRRLQTGPQQAIAPLNVQKRVYLLGTTTNYNDFASESISWLQVFWHLVLL